MPLGISAAAAKSPCHVPIQILAVMFAAVGYVLGGRILWHPSCAPNNPHMYSHILNPPLRINCLPFLICSHSSATISKRHGWICRMARIRISASAQDPYTKILPRVLRLTPGVPEVQEQYAPCFGAGLFQGILLAQERRGGHPAFNVDLQSSSLK
ncbi:hypothetical protein BJ742DRAFT_534848 [Cladochytrium replicatum]|nr:hypothetical protein BJ742DRAFT_534848 [Cladochytrium replicatum]